MYLIFSGTVGKSCSAQGGVHSGGQLTESAFFQKTPFLLLFLRRKSPQAPIGALRALRG